jgi:DNA repair exonuclease SbcCD ATPase subunit
MDLAGQASVYQRSQSQASERERWLEEMRRQLEELKSRRQQFGLELAQLTARIEKLKLCLGYWQREPASAVQDFSDDEGLALAELRRLLENLERHVAVEQALQRLRLRQTPAAIPIPIGDGTSSPPPER